jgi:putative transcriptional regulator
MSNQESEENLIQAVLLPDGRLMQVMPDGSLVEFEKDSTDWEQLAAMTDEEVEVNAFSDPDGGWRTEQEFVESSFVPLARLIRLSSGLTLETFAERYEIPLETLRDWDQGASEPDAAGCALLKIIHHRPEIVAKSLARFSGRPYSA